MTISNNGFKRVIPDEAMRDVLTGKVAYILVDKTGLTKFESKHALALFCIWIKKYLKNTKIILVLEDIKGFYKQNRREYINLGLISKGVYGGKVYEFNVRLPVQLLSDVLLFFLQTLISSKTPNSKIFS